MENNFEDTNIINIRNKEIRDKELKKYIQYKLGKDNIESEDLKKIKDIILNGETLTGYKNNIYFDEIDLFENLEQIKICNTELNKDNITKLSNLKEISIKECRIDSLQDLSKVTKLSIKSSSIKEIESIGLLSQIEELELIDLEIYDFTFLENLYKLKTLKIKNIKDFEIEKINFNLPIKYLSLEKIHTLSTEAIQKFTHLEYLSVDKEEAKNFVEQLDKIAKGGVKILLNDIYNY